MRVFVTGATGFIGSAVVTRTDRRRPSGARPRPLGRRRERARRGGRRGPSRRRSRISTACASGAAAADGVIHTRLQPRLLEIRGECENDRRAIEAIGAALEGSEPAAASSPRASALAGARPARDRGRSAPPTAFPARLGGRGRCRRGARRARIGRAPAAVDPWRGRPRLRPAPDRDRARERRLGLYRRRAQPLAGAHRLDAARLYRLALEKGAGAAAITRSPRKACRSGTSPR